MCIHPHKYNVYGEGNPIVPYNVICHPKLLILTHVGRGISIEVISYGRQSRPFNNIMLLCQLWHVCYESLTNKNIITKIMSYDLFWKVLVEL